MRIAYLSIGRHLHTERWIQYFARAGHDCHLLTVQPGPIEGVEVHDISTQLPTKPLRYFASLQRVRTLLGQIQPDLLHTHFLTGYGYWGHFSGFRPNLLTVWGDDVYVTPHETALKGWLARKALRSAYAVTGDSVDILRECSRMGASAASCYEVQWGVDFEVFRPDRKSSVRESLGIANDAPVIFSPRSFTQPYYNLDVIIAACSRLMAEAPQTHVIFAGYEGDQTPFVERARAAGLDRNTHFVGRIPHQQFADYLVACDVFVSVPSVDATAVSLLEAMACGCGIVVSTLASSLEWIQAGVNGETVPPRDEQSLLDAMRLLLSNDGLRRTYGERCVAEVRSRADHATNMAWMESLYEESIAKGSVSPQLQSLQQRGLA